MFDIWELIKLEPYLTLQLNLALITDKLNMLKATARYQLKK
jgi:hypothetical protein